MHVLKLTNATRLIAHNLIHVPDTFSSPSEMLRAGILIEKLGCHAVDEKELTPEYLSGGESELELSEIERDLLKKVVAKHAVKLTPSRGLTSLLTQLGFEP